VEVVRTRKAGFPSQETQGGVGKDVNLAILVLLYNESGPD